MSLSSGGKSPGPPSLPRASKCGHRLRYRPRPGMDARSLGTSLGWLRLLPEGAAAVSALLLDSWPSDVYRCERVACLSQLWSITRRSRDQLGPKRDLADHGTGRVDLARRTPQPRPQLMAYRHRRQHRRWPRRAALVAPAEHEDAAQCPPSSTATLGPGSASKMVANSVIRNIVKNTMRRASSQLTGSPSFCAPCS
jgi:hypothetical protein